MNGTIETVELLQSTHFGDSNYSGQISGDYSSFAAGLDYDPMPVELPPDVSTEEFLASIPVIDVFPLSTTHNNSVILYSMVSYHKRRAELST